MQTNSDNPCLHLEIFSSQIGVRDGLRSFFRWLEKYALSNEERGAIETVLAEVLNNIEEHAYSNNPNGKIDLSVEMQDGFLRFRVCDFGHAMPENQLPTGILANMECDFIDLPEGGFGWFLIRTLTADIAYQRLGNKNRLSFTMPKEHPYRLTN